MAMQDLSLLFTGLSQAITVSAPSAHVIDLGALGGNAGQFRDRGVGGALHVAVTVLTAMTDAGSDATVDVVLQTDDIDTFSPTPTTLATLMTIPAVSPAGYRRVVPLPIKSARDYERFIRLQFNVNNGPLVTGSLRAGIVVQPDEVPIYATAQPAGV